jgi:hypothetical protein
MTLFAISDLHLGFTIGKTMDRFGPQWVDHPQKVARAWRERVGPADTVLICGDTSWALRLAEAAADLDFVAALPGRKILLRGNHDYWWNTVAKVRRALPSGMEVLQNESFVREGWRICGARGWLLPGAPERTTEDEVIFQRELGRLRLSLESAIDASEPRLAMLHYPPYLIETGTSPVLDLLLEYEVKICVYGHLHAMAPATYPSGVYQGIRFHCVSADLVDFAPQPVT